MSPSRLHILLLFFSFRFFSCDFIAAQSPLSFQQLRDSALQNNISLRRARLEIESASK